MHKRRAQLASDKHYAQKVSTVGYGQKAREQATFSDRIVCLLHQIARKDIFCYCECEYTANG